METRILKIDEDTKLDRLDKILAEKLDFSRKRIKDLLDAKMELVEAKKNQLGTVVNIYKSLGGGWK